MTLWHAAYQAGSATASPASRPYIQHFKDQFGQSQQKGQSELSGERISGPAGNAFPEASSEGSEEGNFAVHEDDVELEKSNILMLGPTGVSCTAQGVARYTCVMRQPARDLACNTCLKRQLGQSHH